MIEKKNRVFFLLLLCYLDWGRYRNFGFMWVIVVLVSYVSIKKIIRMLEVYISLGLILKIIK